MKFKYWEQESYLSDLIKACEYINEHICYLTLILLGGGGGPIWAMQRKIS